MCCLKIYTDTLLANCLNTCKTKSFSADDLQKIVQRMANAENRYIFSDTSEDTLQKTVEKYPHIFCFIQDNKIALCEKWKQEGEALPMDYFNFGYAADTINMLTKTVQKFCEH